MTAMGRLPEAAAKGGNRANDLTIKVIGPGIQYLQEDDPRAIAHGIVGWSKENGLV